MKVDIFDMNKMIEVNHLKEVTNPIMLERDGIPTRGGLLSYDIFGRTNDERRETWGYVNLYGHFIHPLLYKVIKRIDRRFEQIIAGQLRVIVDANGILQVDEENGWTGLEDLYKNFKKIKFKKSYSNIRTERIDLFDSLKLDEIFVSKWLIDPPFYRDVQLNKKDKGKISYDIANENYSKLIRMSTLLANDMSGLALINNATRIKIQNLLVEIYTGYMKGEISGKDQMFKRFVLGKSVDYGVRSVITAPTFRCNTYKDMEVDFYHAGIPMAMVAVQFYPFVFKWIKDHIYNNLYLVKDNFNILDAKGNLVAIKLASDNDIFDDKYIDKQIDLFAHSYADRFKPIYLKSDDGKQFPLILKGYTADKNDMSDVMRSSISRPMTWTDLIYRACVDVTKDKHVDITRYPLEDYFGIFPNRISVLSTIYTVPVIINGTLYKRYPKIDVEMSPSQVATQFIDTIKLSNLYLKGLGGDYDGDQVTAKGIWTQEANEEQEKLLKSKKNLLNVYGETVRATEKTALQTFFNLTE